MTARVVILGLGNILLGDEGIGVRVVEKLAREYVIPPAVEVVDGGTSGIDLLPFVRKDSVLVIVDAVKPERSPGMLIRLEGEEVPAFLSAKLSPHQIGLPDLLATAELLDQTPERVVFLGAEPYSVGTGIELSSEMMPVVDRLIEKVKQELLGLGVELKTTYP